jgi:hypothetical protein
VGKSSSSGSAGKFSTDIGNVAGVEGSNRLSLSDSAKGLGTPVSPSTM